ncbi:hypothetical protein L3081_17730 [Colwellia sp. MSW7]|uniref:Lipoprotein n=1 Tax=Colwellia maritima TaxID=2912588 RepID=A0ABS9X3S4_9GAMM|nr:hypothetical protein [Colwellia maritima]MCI2284893.1 hypothetical protein [Colwellia maritima]
MMKKHKASLILYTIFFTTMLLTACGDNTQKQTPSTVINKQSLKSTEELMRSVTDSSAHWLTTDLLVLPKTNTAIDYQLLSSSKTGMETVALTKMALPSKVEEQSPHLRNFQAFQVNLSRSQAKAWLKQPLFVAGIDAKGEVKKVSTVQTGAVIDALYTEGDNDADEVKDLGATILTNGVSFKLWAPTAQKVELLLFNDDSSGVLTPLKHLHLL